MADTELTPDLLLKLRNLPHVRKNLPGGGIVFVLNTGALIGPEAEAMLQALHSRSIGGILEHLKVLAEKGPEKFMSSYYVGYGHKSIGDCGSATVFIEGVSMLAAKAIQDYPLYSGQESSTRYIDFSKQRFVDPLGTKESRKLLEDWRTFYLKGIAEMIPVIAQKSPRPETEKEMVYEKAVKARAFDIMRSFLPAGASTNLAWHTNLRQFSDRLNLLRHHPLAEVQGIALALEEALLEAFPSSFSLKRYDASEKFYEESMDMYFHTETAKNFKLVSDGIHYSLLKKYRSLLKKRPAKTELPKWLDECGTLQFEFLLDFGSFRDIHRHRAISQRMPLVTSKFGFNNWYLNELSAPLRKEARMLLASQEKKIGKLASRNPLEAQYYVAMGYKLPNRVTGSLPALVYLAELRSGITVHPTLRLRAQEIGAELEKRFRKYGLALHIDKSSDRFDTKRGTHDIVKIS
jgi:thymidylate synthase ThyX